MIIVKLGRKTLKFDKLCSQGEFSETYQNATHILYTKWGKEKEYLYEFMQQFPTNNIQKSMVKVDGYLLVEKIPLTIVKVLIEQKLHTQDFVGFLKNVASDTFVEIPTAFLPFTNAITWGIHFYNFCCECDENAAIDWAMWNFRRDKDGQIYWFDPVFLKGTKRNEEHN